MLMEISLPYYKISTAKDKVSLISYPDKPNNHDPQKDSWILLSLNKGKLSFL